MQDDDAAVGYGKPPKWSQFKEGKSGNPDGRPRGSTNALPTIVLDAVTAQVSIREKGRKRKVTELELTLKAAIEDAKTGDLEAAAFLLQAIKAAKRAGTLGPAVITITDLLPNVPDVAPDDPEDPEGSAP